jgi:hypothetical protein
MNVHIDPQSALYIVGVILSSTIAVCATGLRIAMEIRDTFKDLAFRLADVEKDRDKLMAKVFDESHKGVGG